MPVFGSLARLILMGRLNRGTVQWARPQTISKLCKIDTTPQWHSLGFLQCSLEYCSFQTRLFDIVSPTSKAAPFRAHYTKCSTSHRDLASTATFHRGTLWGARSLAKLVLQKIHTMGIEKMHHSLLKIPPSGPLKPCLPSDIWEDKGTPQRMSSFWHAPQQRVTPGRSEH